MIAEELVAFRDAENRKRMFRVARVITGLSDRGAVIEWQEMALPGREFLVRVCRPSPARDTGVDLPLVLHVHGGGFVGTTVQTDWVNSHLAARRPAVVVSVEHRLLVPGTPLSAVINDGWDVLHTKWCNTPRSGESTRPGSLSVREHRRGELHRGPRPCQGI